ncbi:hypothetical protein GY50_0879 [Dehalococcoides mccartyi GY50]|nr:hypothetical protein GY50_0879 [Dehalococcoides mccartyi GY50]
MPEWLIGADCKSAALRATQVRTLPSPEYFMTPSGWTVGIKINIM